MFHQAAWVTYVFVLEIRLNIDFIEDAIPLHKLIFNLALKTKKLLAIVPCRHRARRSKFLKKIKVDIL